MPDAVDTLAAQAAQADGPVELRALLGECGLLVSGRVRGGAVVEASAAWQRVAARARGWDGALVRALLTPWADLLAVPLATNPQVWASPDARHALQSWLQGALHPLPTDPEATAYAALDALVRHGALRARSPILRDLLERILPPAVPTSVAVQRVLPILLSAPRLPHGTLRRLAEAVPHWMTAGLGVTMVLDDLAHHPQATLAVWRRLLVPGTPLGRNAALRLGKSPLLTRRVAFRRCYREVAIAEDLPVLWRYVIQATPSAEFLSLYRSARSDTARTLIAHLATDAQLSRLPKVALLPLLGDPAVEARTRALLALAQSEETDPADGHPPTTGPGAASDKRASAPVD